MEILNPESPTLPQSPSSPRRLASTSNSFSNQQSIPEVKRISILNFNQNSPNVVFTEPETIEALKRLGYDQSEFNYRPLVSFYSNPINRSINQKINKFDLNATNSNLNAISSSNEYRKDTLENSMKHSAAKEMYQKYMNRRQEMIDRTIAMRDYLIKSDQKNENVRITGNVRKAKLDLDRNISNLEKIKNDDQNRLHKLAVVKMRDLSRDQDNMNKSMRTTERFHEIDEGNLEQTHFVDDLRSRKGFRSNDSTLPTIDRTTYRGTQLLKGTTNGSTFNRSYNGYSSNSNVHSQWFTNKLTNLDEMKLNIELHENHLKSVREKKENIEIEKRNANLNSITTKEERNKKYMNELRAQQEEKKQIKHEMMEQRAESARQTREALNQKEMDDTYNSYIQNKERADRVLVEQKNKKFLDTLHRKFQLEEKLQNVRHSYNAMNYNAQIDREKKAEVDESLTSVYQARNSRVNYMKKREKLDFEYNRQKLNKEANDINLNAMNMYDNFDDNASVDSRVSMNSQSTHNFDETQKTKTFSISNFSNTKNPMNMSLNLTLGNTMKESDMKKMRETLGASKNQMNEIMDEAIQSKEELAKTPRIVTGRSKKIKT